MGEVLCDWLTTVRAAQGGGRHELRHHALFDALQLRKAYVQAEVAGALGWP